MTIPTSNQIIRPVLEYLARNETPVKLAILIEFLKKKFELTEEERQEKVPSGGNRFRARVIIATNKMESSRQISKPQRGYLAITEKGREEVEDISPPVEKTTGDRPNPPPVEETGEPKADVGVSDNNDKFYQEIVKLYLMKNEVKPEQLPSVLESLRKSLNVQQPPTSPSVTPSPTQPTSQEPAVPIRDSVSEEHIICLECGKNFTSLKRHLGSHHLTTPEKYREKWRLPTDYPMIAKKSSEKRSKTARNMGLGQKGQAAKKNQSQKSS